jgi:hypothetical protein
MNRLPFRTTARVQESLEQIIWLVSISADIDDVRSSIAADNSLKESAWRLTNHKQTSIPLNRPRSCSDWPKKDG